MATDITLGLKDDCSLAFPWLDKNNVLSSQTSVMYAYSYSHILLPPLTLLHALCQFLGHRTQARYLQSWYYIIFNCTFFPLVQCTQTVLQILK